VQRHLVPWVVWWIALFWLWMLLVGEWNRDEWIAATIAATLGATLGEIARTRAGVHARVPMSAVAGARRVPYQIFVDFGILLYALALSAWRREVVRGVFRAHEFPAGGDDPDSVGERVWTMWAANFSPNAIAIDIDPERNLSLVHDLIPNRSSEKPA
jgi:hypothetical protein